MTLVSPILSFRVFSGEPTWERQDFLLTNSVNWIHYLFLNQNPDRLSISNCQQKQPDMSVRMPSHLSKRQFESEVINKFSLPYIFQIFNLKSN